MSLALNHCTCIDHIADLVVLDVLSCGDDFLLKVAGRNQISAFTADMRRYFERQRAVVLGKMPPERSYVPYTKAPGDQWLFPEAEWNDKLAKVGEPYITQSIETSGIATMFDLNPELVFNPRSIAMQQYVNKHKFKFSFNVNQETMKQLRREFAAGIDLGEGIRKLRKRVEKVFDIAEKFRSERIARSEIVRASSAAAEEAYKQSGVVEGKEWVANPDACIWCSSMHGTTMGLGGNYFTQGEQLEVDGSVMHFDYSDITYPPLHPNCYSDDTEVYTEAGWMGIPLVLKGTQVLTLEPESKNLEWGKVVETVSYEVDEMVSLTNKQGSFDMMITSDHPFFGYTRIDGNFDPVTINGVDSLDNNFMFYSSYIPDNGWDGAKELTPQYKMFRNISAEVVSYDGMVYDLEVDRNHTILTRRNGRVVWGSNCKCTLIPIVRLVDVRTAEDVRRELLAEHDAGHARIGMLDNQMQAENKKLLNILETDGSESQLFKDQVARVQSLSKDQADLKRDILVKTREKLYVNPEGFEIKHQVLRTRGVDPEIVEEFTNRIDNALSELSKYTSPDIFPDRKMSVNYYEEIRSFGNRAGINISAADARPGVTSHEVMHWLEGNSTKFSKKSQDFLAVRTKGERAVSLRQATGNAGYGADEVFKKDKFIDPYMGRIYDGNATEIASTGVQYMIDNPVKLAKEDPGLFNFMYDLLRGN